MISRRGSALAASMFVLLVSSLTRAQGIDTLALDASYFNQASLTATRDSAWNVFKALVDSGNVRHFGITDPAEIVSGTIGEPWLETTITGHALRGYTPSLHIPVLYSWEMGRKFPIVNAGRAVGLITLVNSGNGMKARAYSPPRLANAVQAAKTLIASRYGISPSHMYGVRFPTLHRYFLAARDANNELMFFSVFGDPDLNLAQPGDMSFARNILSMLSDRARMDPGGPR